VENNKGSFGRKETATMLEDNVLYRTPGDDNYDGIVRIFGTCGINEGK